MNSQKIHENYHEVKEKLSNVFKRLRAEGIVAKQNFLCCSSCAWSALSSDYKGKETNGFVFYHSQDNDSLKENGEAYLAFGVDDDKKQSSVMVGLMVCFVCELNGLAVEWDRTSTKRILVRLPEKPAEDLIKN